MSILKYRAFLATVKYSSISKAADALNYSQPNVSHMISSLEREIGFPLLSRTQNGVFPTKEAECLIPRMQQIVSAEDAIIQTSYQIQGIEIGSLRVGTYLSVVSHLLPPIVSSYLNCHSKIEMEFYVGTNAELFRYLTGDTIDIAITSDLIPDRYTFIPLFDDPLCAILPENNPLSTSEIIDLNDLIMYPFIIPREDADNDIISILEKEQLKATILFRLRGGLATCAMINEGLGVTLCYKLACISDVAAFKKIKVLPLKQNYYRTIGICFNSFQSLSPVAQSFVQQLMSECNGEGKCF